MPILLYYEFYEWRKKWIKCGMSHERESDRRGKKKYGRK